ncbi:DUF4235 domain-containing protein [Pseudonocardia acidicola]|uniref:DUF4235 domain-containing protein n=1 Tax=Pseudonocardia acidicola TaxID=2724939 RepID=A0ABX1SCT7_9PSEU|nr:DUF4235 domain-containing protein [Pseudonocardia acidicola]NMH98161.1 DUF4235 domain-containing protein [Pseudonocardia acidicola]
MGSPTKKPSTGELSGPLKIAYKPVGLLSGVIGGVLAGQVFAVIWKRISHEDDTPAPLSEDYSTREVLFAAALQGAVFGLVKTAVDRYGMKAFRRFVDKPRPPSDRMAR